MAAAGEAVVLVSYLDDSGDPMEWVLEDLPDEDVEAIAAYLEEHYPCGDVRVSAVPIETPADLLGDSVADAVEYGEPVSEAIRRLAARR